jgi:hypothetical protein
VIADLTITPARQAVADFADPMFRGIREVVVTAPGEPPVGERRGPRRAQRLRAPRLELLGAPRGAQPQSRRGRQAAVKLVEAAPELEAEDILEMVDAASFPRPSSTATRRRCGSRCSRSTR